MKIFITTILFLFFVTISKAQYLQDIQGRVMNEQSYTDIIGSPFFNTDFINGNVVLTNGEKYGNVALKYNSFTDELFFKNVKDGSLLSFVVPVKSFEMLGQKYANGFPSVDNFTGASYYQIVADSKVKLLFKSYKVIIESKPYNAVNLEKRFEENKLYYVFKEGQLQRFKPSKKDLLEVFSEKSVELDAYLKKEKIDFKSNNDLAKLFEFYSSL